MTYDSLHPTTFYDTFPDYLAGMESLYGEKFALSCYTRTGEEQTLTYTELCAQIRALRVALCSHNLQGKHVAILSENSFAWLIAYFAIVSCGGVAVCIDTEQPDEAIREMVLDSDSAAVFASSVFVPICLPLLETANALPLVHMDAPGEDGTNAANTFPTLTDWVEAGNRLLAENPDAAQPMALDPDQIASIAFTSGTTSTSKMVMLSHRNLLKNASEAVSYVFMGPKVFTPLPFYHTYGLTCSILNNLVRGAHIVINGDMRTLFRNLSAARPYAFVAVPLMVESLYNQIWVNAKKNGTTEALRRSLRHAGLWHGLGIKKRHPDLEEIHQTFFAGVTVIITGGASIDAQICEKLELLGVLVLQGYGITECSPLISANHNAHYRHGSVGRALRDTEVRFVDDEIWVKGPSVMHGYYKNPAQTAEAIEDSWFKTGDLGHMDKDGFLFITGRKKNQIVFKNGKKLSPEKIEAVLQGIPLIKEVVIHSTQAKDVSSDIQLVASIYPDPALTEGLSPYEVLTALQEEVNAINDTLPSYQRIELINVREQEFEKTATKKTKRHLI